MTGGKALCFAIKVRYLEYISKISQENFMKSSCDSEN